MSFSLDDVQRSLRALQQAAQDADRRSGDFQRMRDEINEVRGRVTASDGTVTVTAGPSGSIRAIEFTEDAMRKSPSELSSIVMRTLRQATAEASRQQAELVREHVPESDVVERVLRFQREATATTGTDPSQATGHRPDESAESTYFDESAVPETFLEDFDGR